MKNKERSRNKLGVLIAAALIILLGLSTLLSIPFLINYLLIFQPAHMLDQFLFFLIVLILLSIAMSIFFSISNIVLGIALLKLKFWAWRLTCALCIAVLLSPLVNASLLGLNSLNFRAILISSVITLLVLIYFLRPKIKALFLVADHPFKLKSWYGAILFGWVFSILFFPSASLGYRHFASIRSDHAYLIEEPESINITETLQEKEGFTRKRIMNFSLLVPDTFIIQDPKAEMFEEMLIAILKDSSEQNDSTIVIRDDPDSSFSYALHKKFGFKNAYEFERAVLSENFGLLLMLLRDLVYTGKNTKTTEFQLPDIKGFLLHHIDDNVTTAKIYDQRGKHLGVIHFEGKIASGEDPLAIISSLKFLPPDSSEVTDVL